MVDATVGSTRSSMVTIRSSAAGLEPLTPQAVLVQYHARQRPALAHLRRCAPFARRLHSFLFVPFCLPSRCDDENICAARTRSSKSRRIVPIFAIAQLSPKCLLSLLPKRHRFSQ